MQRQSFLSRFAPAPEKGQRAASSSTGVVLAIAIVVNLLLVAVVDGYWLAKGAPENTISAVLRSWNAKLGGLPALAFIALFVHLFIRLPMFWSDPAVVAIYNAGQA